MQTLYLVLETGYTIAIAIILLSIPAIRVMKGEREARKAVFTEVFFISLFWPGIILGLVGGVGLVFLHAAWVVAKALTISMGVVVASPGIAAYFSLKFAVALVVTFLNKILDFIFQ